MNGNLMLHVPMPFSYPQRGAKLKLLNQLTISSKNWSVQCDPGCHWVIGGGVDTLTFRMGTGVAFDYNTDHIVHRSTVRGSDSQGNYGNTSGYGAAIILPHSQLKVDIPRLAYYMAVSGYPADRGVLPDIPVLYSIQELLAKKDKEMELALALAGTGSSYAHNP